MPGSFSITTYRATEQAKQKYRKIMQNSPRFGTFLRDLQTHALLFKDDVLCPEEVTAISYYTGSVYDTVNAALRDEQDKLSLIVEQWNQYRASDVHTTIEQVRMEGLWNARLLVSGLNALPEYIGVVYRITMLTPEQIARYAVGQEVVEAGFVSASKDNYRNDFGNVRYVVQSEQGRSIEKYSRNRGEAEVLFRPRTRFRVLDVQQQDENTTIYLREVS